MATVTEVSVFYRRQAQPAQYQAEEVRLEGRAAVDDGESWEASAYDLLARARVQAHRVLGLKEPAIAPFALAFGEEASVEPVAEGEKPKRGRPKGSGKKAKGEEVPDDPTPAAAADTTVAAGDDVDLSDIDDMISGGEAPKEITDSDLQREVAAFAKSKGTGPVKDLMAEFGVARLGEMPQDKRAAFLERLNA